jgi:hypothetical protein
VGHQGGVAGRRRQLPDPGPHPGEATGTVDQHGKPVVYLLNEAMSRHAGIPLEQLGLPGQHKRNVTYGDLYAYVTGRLEEAPESVAHPVLFYCPACNQMHLEDPTTGCDGTLRHTRAFAEEHNLDFGRLVARLAAYSLRKEIRCDCDWSVNITSREWLPPDRTIFHEGVPTPTEVDQKFGWYCRTGPDGKVACSKEDQGAEPDLERVYQHLQEQAQEGGCACCGDGTCELPAA